MGMRGNIAGYFRGECYTGVMDQRTGDGHGDGYVSGIVRHNGISMHPGAYPVAPSGTGGRQGRRRMGPYEGPPDYQAVLDG